LIFNNVEAAGNVEWLINDKIETTFKGTNSGLISGHPNFLAGAFGVKDKGTSKFSEITYSSDRV